MNKQILLIFLTSLIGSAQAQNVFWRDSNDGTTGSNWVNGFESGGGVTPGATDTAVFTGNDVDDTTVIYVDSAVTSVAGMELRDRGATLQIRSGGSLSTGAMTLRSDFNQGNFLLSIQGGSFTINNAAYAPSTLGGDTSRLTLSVSSGNLTFNPGGDSNNGLIQNGSNISITGGTVDMGNARIHVDDISTFNWSGGTIQNVNRFIGDNVTAQTLTNGGGTLFVNNNVRTDDLMSYNNGTGSFVFGIESDGTTNAELSQFSGGGVWDLSSGSVAVDFGSYTPTIGDLWDFTSLAAGASGFLASAGNISSTSADGNWNVTWDTSSWESDGILAIDGINAIPEPSSLALLGLAALTVVMIRRRKA